MKLPLRLVPGTTPPQFVYTQIVSRMDGSSQAIECIGYVPAAMETPLCDLLRIAQQLAKENEELKK